MRIVNAKDKEEGWTALRWAAEEVHTEIVKLLLDTGNVKAQDGFRALILAAKLGHTEIVRILKAAGARQ